MTIVADLTTVRYSGDLRADALLGQMADWNFLLPARTTLYYTFDLSVIEEATAPVLTAFNAAQQAAAMQILDHVSSVCGIGFVATPSGAEADLHFGACNIAGDEVTGLATTRESWSTLADSVTDYSAEAFIYLDNAEFESTNVNPTAGSSGYQTLLHEIGHALGLGHPFDGQYLLPADEDNTDNTVMSYTSVGENKTTFQDYDLLALRWIYGEDGLRGNYGLNSIHGPSLEGDTTAPTVATFSPADEASGVAPGSDIVVTFSEAVQRGTGNITLKTAAGQVVEAFDAATSANLSISEGSLTIDPTLDLIPGMGYVLEIAAGAVRDLAGNDHAGTASYNFETVANEVTGTAQADELTGTVGRDTMAGLAGSDTLTGGAGNDDLDGGAGIDVAVYSGQRAAYGVHSTAGGWSVIDNVGADGHDGLTGIERLQFSDARLALDLDGNAGSVARLLGALFGAQAMEDSVLVGQYLSLLDNGASDEQMAAVAVASERFAQLAGSHGNTDFVRLVYTNVFGVAPSAAELATYVPLLDGGTLTQAALALLAAHTAQNAARIDFGGLSQNGLAYTLAAPGTVQFGTDGPDVLTGTVGDDHLYGLAGNDSLTGGPGNDSIEGAAGTDLVVFGGLRTGFTLAKGGAGWTVTDTTAVEGTDQLSGIERLQFADVNVALDLDSGAGTVAKILGAVFGEAAVNDEVYAGIGLHYIDTGMSYEGLMQLAIDARLGAGASHRAVVDLLYTNVIGSAPSNDEMAEFVNLLDSHAFTVAGLGVYAADSDFNELNVDLVGLAQTGLEYVAYFEG
ncbi:MAG: Ig-like domain-containing protein [Rubrivivax sp.]|nr:Ig-like domain-containing protein [Rubrivivax sp.]